MDSEYKETKRTTGIRTPLLPNNTLSSTPETPSPNKWRKTSVIIAFAIWLILAVVLPILLYSFTNIINSAITQFILSIGLLIPIVSLVGWQFFNNVEKATDKKIQIYSLPFENFYRYTGRALAVAVTFTGLAAILVLIGICFPAAGTLPWVVAGASVAFITILLYAVYLYVYKKSSFDDRDDLILKIKASFFSSKGNILFFTLSIVFSITIALLISLDPAKLIAPTLWTAMLSTVLAAIAIFIVLRQFASFSLILLPHGKLEEQIEKLYAECKCSSDLGEALEPLKTIKRDANCISSEKILGLRNALANLPSNATEKLQLLKWLANDPPYGYRTNLHYACEMLSFNPSLSARPIYIRHMCNGLRINGALERENIFSTLPKEIKKIMAFEGAEAIKGALGAGFEEFETIENEAIMRHAGVVLAFLKEERLLTADGCEAIIKHAHIGKWEPRANISPPPEYTTILEGLSHIPHILKLIKDHIPINHETLLVITQIPNGKVLASILDKISAIRNAPDVTKCNHPSSLDSLSLQAVARQLTSIIRSDEGIPPIINLLNDFLQEISDNTFFPRATESYKQPIRRFLTSILLTTPYLLRFIKPEDFTWYIPDSKHNQWDAANKMHNLDRILAFLNPAGSPQPDENSEENYKKLMECVKAPRSQNTYQLALIAEAIICDPKPLTVADQISVFFETAEEVYNSKENNWDNGSIKITHKDFVAKRLQEKINAKLNHPTQAGDTKLLTAQGNTSTPTGPPSSESKSLASHAAATQDNPHQSSAAIGASSSATKQASRIPTLAPRAPAGRAAFTAPPSNPKIRPGPKKDQSRSTTSKPT